MKDEDFINTSMKTFSQYLEEKLILYGQGKKYGQIVFLAGGAGSRVKDLLFPTSWKKRSLKSVT